MDRLLVPFPALFGGIPTYTSIEWVGFLYSNIWYRQLTIARQIGVLTIAYSCWMERCAQINGNCEDHRPHDQLHLYLTYLVNLLCSPLSLPGQYDTDEPGSLLCSLFSRQCHSV